eukprot:9659736-Alexandrium_andersonii.AAC.1
MAASAVKYMSLHATQLPLLSSSGLPLGVLGIPLDSQKVTLIRKVNCTSSDAGQSARGAATRGGNGGEGGSLLA